MYRGTTPTFTFTLPIECETISMTVGDQLIDFVTCTKEDDGWHIDLHPVQEE